MKVELQEVKELKIDSKPYELLNKHLYRFKLYKVKDEYVFYFDFHHIITDGSSIKVFIDDFFKALEGRELETEKSDAICSKIRKNTYFYVRVLTINDVSNCR